MERALNLHLVLDALGVHPILTQHSTNPSRSTQRLDSPPSESPTAEDWEPALPTAEELQMLIARTEVQLFLHQRDFPFELLRSAWYLHGVASARSAEVTYTATRQRNAFSLSAHIFDLASDSDNSPLIERLKFAFGAEVGYHRSEKPPNALAVARRVEPYLAGRDEVLENLDILALEAGVAFLGLDVLQLRAKLALWRPALADFAARIGLDDLTATVFAPTYCVVESVHEMVEFLALGERGALERAQGLLTIALSVGAGAGDHDARWVASHLLFVGQELEAGSVWTILPTDIPSGAKQAFTLAPATVLSLWPPQRKLLGQEDSQGERLARSALDVESRRIVLSVPTSAGKTLISELLTISYLSQNAERRRCLLHSPTKELGSRNSTRP